jgi:hypothetical protein
MSDEMDTNIIRPGQPTHDRGKPIAPPVTTESEKLQAKVDYSSSIVCKDDEHSDITVNISEIARMHKQGGESWSYLSIHELNEKDVRIECAVLINGDLAGALKIAREKLGEKG